MPLTSSRIAMAKAASLGAVLMTKVTAVLFMGVYPNPFTEVMHASVADLLRHVAQPKF